MRPATHPWLAFAWLVAVSALVLGCGSSDPTGTITPTQPTSPPVDAIPSSKLREVLQAHFEGVGAMEQYRYGDAATAFRRVRTLAPDWSPGKINLAIALLNDVGVKSEEARKQGGDVSKDNFAEALDLLDDVLRTDPNHLHAHYCRGVILQYLGDIDAAHRDFQFVVDKDPSDGHAWFRLASTLSDPDRPGFRAGLNQAGRLIDLYENALKRNPYLVPAYYNLFQVTGWAASQAKTPEEREALSRKQNELLAIFQQLNPQENPAGPGERGGNVYGEMGRYARLLGPEPPPARPSEVARPLPRFAAAVPLRVDGLEADASPSDRDRWATPADLSQAPNALFGWVRQRFGPALAVFDANGDGRLDLYLAAAVVGPDGLRDALLINEGEGRFEDASDAFGLPRDRASLGVAAGDFDADRFVDLYLTGAGGNRLLRNIGGKQYADVTAEAGVGLPGSLSLTARWLDLDQDGDLDLYMINYTKYEHVDEMVRDGSKPPGAANAAFRNDGKPAPRALTPPRNLVPAATATSEQPGDEGLSLAFTPWPDASALVDEPARHTGLAALDIDNDRDIDLVLAAEDTPARVVLNDRLGRFRPQTHDALKLPDRVNGLLIADLDQDGQSDVVATNPDGALLAWHNRSARGPDGATSLQFTPRSIAASRWIHALVADPDLDGAVDLIGVAQTRSSGRGGPSRGQIEWARHDGPGHVVEPLGILNLDGTMPSVDGVALADLVGDPLPDLVLVENGCPSLARNLGNGHHWLALDLSGRWKFSFDHMRTNPHGLGTRLALQTQGLHVPFEYTTPAGGLAQSVAPFVLGMRDKPSADLLRLTWPDGVMQAELQVPANQRIALAEYNRKTGSCPVLFTWNGRRFECIGDFLGGGGLGYLVEPGVYSQPDRDEGVLIGTNQLVADRGAYRLRVLEPMDEIAYLDQLTLEVIDAPPGVTVVPDERFAPGGNRPSGALLVWRDTILPRRATDLAGHDVTERLLAFDRATVDTFRRLKGWIGYAEEHGIVLDFGDRLSRFGPDDRLVLGLAGWVEYPYSQTNYAASTAGVPLRPPVLERLRDDGVWEVIEADPGYPAGLPRLTTLELTGKLTGPRCVLRLRTNMECYWDQAFVAVLTNDVEVRATRLPIAQASLGYRGYVREVSPDGRLPLMYDYDAVDPAPLARFHGWLTRYGDVLDLLRDDDDRLCLVGPGDELALEFDETRVPSLPEGWTRRFVLRSIGYCKDADPFTAASDDVGPLPWKNMPPYPFGSEGERPIDSAYESWLRTDQVRHAGNR
jgi:tetratricopeptide (TPR) repeat protein